MNEQIQDAALLERSPAARVLFGNVPNWAPRISAGMEKAGHLYHMAPFGQSDLTQFDALVPLTLGCYRVLDQERGLGRAVPSLWPKADAVALAGNKVRMSRHLEAHGFGAHVPKLWETLPEDDSVYPLIARPAQGSWGRNAFILQSSKDAAIEKLDETHFLQCYVPGVDEYATHILLKSGEIRFTRTVHYQMFDAGCAAEPYVKGIERRQRSMSWSSESPFLPLMKRILDSFGYADGLCCIDYRIVEGHFWLFEVNPRFGGSLSMRIEELIPAYLDALN
ncbi:hypothetical protein ACSBLW_06275 [Thioclava sp. FR2]|uniref:hypothetical protein n=1 Tax=Thioclava sp. FR2 TaxID=3445780 RepID=UPI003EBBC7A1